VLDRVQVAHANGLARVREEKPHPPGQEEHGEHDESVQAEREAEEPRLVCGVGCHGVLPCRLWATVFIAVPIAQVPVSRGRACYLGATMCLRNGTQPMLESNAPGVADADQVVRGKWELAHAGWADRGLWAEERARDRRFPRRVRMPPGAARSVTHGAIGLSSTERAFPLAESRGFQEVEMMLPHHLAGRSPEPSPCGYAISALAASFASGGRPATTRRFALLPRCRPSQERLQLPIGV